MVPEAREAGQGHQGDKGRADPFDLWCPCLLERLERARLRRASYDCDKPDRKTHKQTSSQITGGQNGLFEFNQRTRNRNGGVLNH